MSRSIPPEIIDLIVDNLEDRQSALRACCLVSKSWVPRCRVHLFARVRFTNSSIESWVKTFPDPSNSPAHYTRSLTFRGRWFLTDAGPVVARRIRAFPFHNVAHLTLGFKPSSGLVSLVPFHGLLPTIRSLRLEFTCIRPSEVLGLACSFPLLEDLALFPFSYWIEVDRGIPPPTSPRLTGSLQLHSMGGGMSHITRWLLNLPNGLNFTKIALLCVDEEIDFNSATDLVSRCSDTLESLDVSEYLPGVFFFFSFPAPDRHLIAEFRHVHGGFD